ncbi:hypothetical protein EU538_04550 [Candidatus Thorarchaeota archaeon]|nr:MAG: hypothetical protein EU538_04550 [Candidatus Thorarchaeota archaeon]
MVKKGMNFRTYSRILVGILLLSAVSTHVDCSNCQFSRNSDTTDWGGVGSRTASIHELGFTVHEPILIESDSDFSSQGFSGSGTEQDPYIIENLEIHSAEECIEVRNTSSYFIIRNCRLQGHYNNHGILMTNTTNAQIRSNVISSTFYGVSLHSSPQNHMADNYLLDNVYSGLWLYGSGSSVVSGNTFENNGIHISGSRRSEWKQTITSNNTVNGLPVGYFWSLSTGKIDGDLYGQVILANCTGVTVRDGDFSSGTTGILLGFSSYNLLIHNTISDMVRAGISLYASTDNTIANNSLSESNGGANAYYAPGNCFEDNNVSGNQFGLNLYSSPDTVILRNSIADNSRSGVHLSSSPSCLISGNVFDQNGLTIDGSEVNVWHQFVATNNVVNGLLLGYFWGLRGVDLDGATYGQLILANCSNMLVEGGTFSNASCGIQLGFSYQNFLTGNTVSANEIAGMFLYKSSNNTLFDNSIFSNGDVALELRYSDYNTLRGNSITKNENTGILISYGSNGNLLYLNILAGNNGLNARDYGHDNHWNYTTRGNYWDTYAGSSHYDVYGDAGSIDYHPMRWGGYPSVDWVPVVLAAGFIGLTVIGLYAGRARGFFGD